MKGKNFSTRMEHKETTVNKKSEQAVLDKPKKTHRRAYDDTERQTRQNKNSLVVKHTDRANTRKCHSGFFPRLQNMLLSDLYHV